MNGHDPVSEISWDWPPVSALFYGRKNIIPQRLIDGGLGDDDGLERVRWFHAHSEKTALKSLYTFIFLKY